jgi:hypothetical protein
MKKLLAVPVLLALSCAGCSSPYQTAVSFQKVIAGVLSIAQSGVSALPAADQPIASQWVAGATTLDGQLGTCITAAGTSAKAAAFGTCFDTFATGLTSPAELAQLRVMSATSQAKVELWATAAVLAVNGFLDVYDLVEQAQPQIAAAPSHRDLVAFAHRVGVPAYGF